MAFSPETYALLKAQGGGGGGGSSESCFFFVEEDAEEFSLNKTWNEIFAAIGNGKMCIIKSYSDENGEEFASMFPVIKAYYDGNGGYMVECLGDGGTVTGYSTNSKNGYPVMV